jgi:AcrR family transcriptional regulator
LSANTPKTIVSRAEKRDAILAAARQIFSTRGVIDVTMEDIAKAAKVSKGALYLHFASKDELYLHLSAQGGKGLLERMKQAKSASTGFLRVKAMAHEYAEYCREDPTRFRLDVAWLAPGYQVDFKFPMAQEYRAVITEVMRVTVEAFVEGQRDGSILPDLSPGTTVYQIWGAILGLVILRAKAVAKTGPSLPQADPQVWQQVAAGTGAGIDLDGFVPNFIDRMMTLVEARPAEVHSNG